MTKPKARNLNWFHRFTYSVVTYTELFFYNVGCYVGKNPIKTITFCWIFVILSSLGFLRFYQEKSPIKLWVPPYTSFLKDTEWLLATFQKGYRPQVMLIQAENVLTPEILKEVSNIEILIENSSINNITWKDVCFKLPKIDEGLMRIAQGSDNETDISVASDPALYCYIFETMPEECYLKTILELWGSRRDKIENLTTEEILNKINNYDRNTVYGRLKSFEDLLGGIVRNESGHIVGAKALHNYWMTNVNFSAVDMDKVGNIAGTADWASEDGVLWELEFTRILENATKHARNYEIFYTASRSFGDISSAALFQDIGKLCIGVFIDVVYVVLVISKFNFLEFRAVLAGMGLLTIGMGFLTGCGISSLLGISYGPVHTSLPFLLMGLGVDDMFVLMACWNDLTKEQKERPMHEKIGFMLKHGGVSITVTSLTDVLAFLIGSSTILPSLESYCLYAALGVFMTYIYAITFFSACFVLDQRRLEANRNGIFPWIKHKSDYKPNECSRQDTSGKVFSYIYSNIIFTWTGKVLTLLIAIVCLGLSIQGCLKLEQRFDPTWFVPKETHFYKYTEQRKFFYPTMGFEGVFYMGKLNYSQELLNIKNISVQLENSTNIVTDVISWIDPFRNFVLKNFKTDVYIDTPSEDQFNIFLSKFLFSPKNAMYQANFQFEKPLECGVPVPTILLSNFDFRFLVFSGPKEYIPAMHKMYDIAKYSNFTSGDKFATVWSKVFASWVTDEVIDIEVMRNLQLALLCVMVCTMLLLADIKTCFWVFVCVLLTMVNVCGFMQKWGLTIDLVTCIGLELAIGLCVDYATHIGHTYLTITQGNKTERSLKTVQTIGSAVVFGGISMLIGTFMLSISPSYTFVAFFKIFFLVIIFGLFHGVVVLPVIFTWFGPNPYHTHEIVSQNGVEMDIRS